MSPRINSVVLVLGTLVALTACHKPSEQQKEERAAATAVKEHDRYRALLTQEVAWADRRIADVSKGTSALEGNARAVTDRDLDAARTWRQRLQQDLEFIDRPPPGMDWPALKTRIQHDLDENRPPSMPRIFEKPYGI